MILLLTSFLLFIYMLIWTLIAFQKQRKDIADIAWGLGFSLVAWTSYIFQNKNSFGLILCCFMTVWALRLSIHLMFRQKKQPEDFRYQQIYGKEKTTSFFKLFFEVFLLQGVLLFIISLPIIAIQNEIHRVPSWLFGIAFFLMLIGFFIESVSDLELSTFQKKYENKGTLLTTGLWKYSRHPNFFGELIIWWAIWLLSYPTSFGIYLIISPLLLSYLIIYVSGVKPLENKMKSYSGFLEYQSKTRKLIPFLKLPFNK